MTFGPTSRGHIDEHNYLRDALGLLPTTLADTFPRVVNGRKYVFVGGPIRNAGSGWDLIASSNHRAANIDSVTSDTTEITVNYSSIGATRMVSFIAVPDETLAQNGIICGSSVAEGAATIRLSRAGSINDYVSYSGSSWTAASGLFTFVSFTSGVLVLSHNEMGSRPHGVSLTPRGSTYRTVVSAGGNASPSTTVRIEFYDLATNTLQTTANTNMKVYVSRAGGGALDPSTVNTTNYPNSNIWVLGVFEVGP